MGYGRCHNARALLNLATQFLRAIACLVVVFGASTAVAQERPFPLRTHQPLYQNPFDLASGGASLTRATQEGSFFVNPSLPAFGAGLHRWLFARTQFHVGDAPAKAAYDSYSKQSAASPTPQEIFGKAITKPVHVGHDTALGYINRYVSAVGFSNVRADVAVRKFGDAGTPQVRVRAYGVGGGGMAAHTALGDVLAIGVSSKYIEVAQATDDLSLSDLQNPDDLGARAQDLIKRGNGLSHDAGITLQFRSRRLDLRLAGAVHDIGNTVIGNDLKPFPQTVASGIGLTFHGRKHAMHCGADLRDVLDAYGEHWTYRSYAGCKILIHRLIGFGAGLSQGYPSAGLILNLPASRIEVGSYTREVGQQVGVEGRTVYFFAMGFEW